ncbi:hypothetical protein [Thermobifida cellulosilytica]|jgi:hypothetical protein|uniref:Uncharacterized protein n=1 Tax=Thermobifida cellulosilytica TB100 TaxID=665004 RepID=A0A147KGH6_THECS|nr:hypothetical protein [Thermobifida cellulosilytica]KUP96405.1 hypothetical protein AC529_12365 [Thermobifida cellulosilytica TB100]
MTFKMTWALVAEHADEWTGDSYRQATMILKERVDAAVSASGMNAEAQAHWRETFLGPLRESLFTEGRSAVEAGRDWSKAAGPLLVALTPTS